MTRITPGIILVAALLTGCASQSNHNTPAASVTRSASPAIAVASSTSIPATTVRRADSGTFPAIGTSPGPTIARAAASPATAARSATTTVRPQSPAPRAAGGQPGTSSSTASPSSPGQPSDSGPGAPASPPPGTRAAASANDLNDLIDRIKLQQDDLPPGLSIGGLQGLQANEAAVTGYDDPAAVLQQMRATGRMIGFVQQINTPDAANGAGVSIEVWRDAAGARAYFDKFPRPESSLQYHTIDVPGLSDQVFAYQYQTNGGTGYSIAWRRGRLILGVGALLAFGKPVDPVLELAKLLDQKARAVQQ